MKARTAIAAVGASGIAAAGILAPAASATAAATTAPSATPGAIRTMAADSTVTDFGLSGSAYATRFRGTEIPTDSGRTSWAYVGCTREVGKSAANQLLSADPIDTNGNIVSMSGSETRVWTDRTDGAVASNALSRVADLQISNAVGGLRLQGLQTRTRTWHDATGFHKKATAGFTGFSANLGGLPIPVPSDPQPGDVVEVPGVATLRFFVSKGAVTNKQASTTVDAVRIIIEDGSVLTVGRAYSRIDSDLVAGVLGGRGIALEGTLAGGTVRTGRIANQPLPCPGTDGVTKENVAVDVNGLPGLAISGLRGTARGDQLSRQRAYGETSGRVARFKVGDDDLVVNAIVGVAKVVAEDGKLKRMTTGTTIGSITVNGETMPIPEPGETLVIEGLAKLTPAVVQRLQYGISVTALKVVMLNDTQGESVFKLGQASATLRPR